MIADLLKSKLETEAENLITENPFFIKASKGLIRADHIKYFLNNAAYVLKYTPICLKLAIEKSDDHDLTSFFKEKVREEDGHIEWAFNDLDSFGIDKNIVDEEISENIKLLMNYLLRIIQENPKNYLLYILTAEYVLVLFGHKLLGDLENKCGINPSQLTVLTKHVELDKDHVLDDMKVIERFFNNPTEWSEVEKLINDYMKYISAFYADVASNGVQESI